MAGIGPIIGLLLSAAVTYAMPKKYESESVIEVIPRSEEFADKRLGGSSPRPIPVTQKNVIPLSCEAEIGRIQSRESLVKVIETLGLVEKWQLDKDAALQVLQASLTVQNIRGTDLISIRVRHPSKIDARDIAAEVALAYKTYLSELESQESERRIAPLTVAVKDQEVKVEECRKVLVAIARSKASQSEGQRTEGDASAQPDSEGADRRVIDTQDDVGAKRDFECDQELLQQMKLKLISETISAKMPQASIEIHDDPGISDVPVSPNLTLNLVVGAVVGFLLSPLMSVLMIFVLSRCFPQQASAQ